MKLNIKKSDVFIGVYVFLFVFINYVGYIVSSFDKVIYSKLIIGLLLGALFGIGTPILINKFKNKININFKNKEIKDSKWNFIIIFIINIISYIPALLAYYPSIWTYDITTQVDQIINSGYTRYHPLLHTFLIDVCINIGNNVFGSYTYGALLYSLIQMTIMSICVAYAVSYVIKHFKVNKIILVLILGFYLLMPFNAIMAISTTKDTIFSGLTLVLIVRIYDMLHHGYKKRDVVISLSILILWFSFRNNAYFAFLALAIIALVLFWSCKLKIIAAVCLIVLVNSGFNIVLDKVFNAQTISTAELISVPGSQIARAAINSKDKISEENWNEIDRIFVESYHTYNPYLFDDVKQHMNFGVDKMVPLIGLWAKMLPSCLTDYVDAFMTLNLGSWYIFDDSHARIYIDNYYDLVLEKGSLEGRHQGYLQTSNSDILDIEFKTYLPGVYNYYEAICSDNVLHNNYITRMLLAPGIYLWIILGCLFYAVYKGNRKNILWISLLVLYWMTSLLGPCTLFRYMYPIVIGMPIYLILTFKNKGEKESETKEVC